MTMTAAVRTFVAVVAMVAIAAPVAAQPKQPAPPAKPAPKTKPAGPPAQPPPAPPKDDGDAPRTTGWLGPQVALAIDDCPPKPDLPTDQVGRVAGEHFDRGRTLYDQGDYLGSTRELISAYCLSPYFSVLRSIAYAYERQLEFEQAIAYFARYMREIPADARLELPVAEEKQQIAAKITQLSGLKAQIQVATTPPGANVTLAGDTGLRAVGKSNGPIIETLAGGYAMTVEMDGFQIVTQRIEVRIGKPYAFFFPLEPLKGRLKIRATPADAKIFVEGQLVGQGVYDKEVSRGTYQIEIEASGRIPVKRREEVIAGEVREVAVELPPPRQNGRTQLVIASGFAGAALGGVGVFTGYDDPLIVGVGSFGAAAAAIAGAYFGIPDDYPLGSSSFVITTGLVGAGEGVLIVSLFSEDEETVAGVAGLGLIAGASAAALTADRFDFSPGDAALLNTGALWGTVVGALFATSFDDGTDRGRRIGLGLTLSGLNAGVLAGILLGRNYEISRSHAALIDLAGVTGAASAAALQGIVDSGEMDIPIERRANFAIGGITLGLLAGAYLTRNMDSPKAPKLKPTVVPIKSTGGKMHLGIGIQGDL